MNDITEQTDFYPIYFTHKIYFWKLQSEEGNRWSSNEYLYVKNPVFKRN